MRRIFPPRRPPRILKSGTPTGIRLMAIDAAMILQVADVVLDRRYRRQLRAGYFNEVVDQLAADVQAHYSDPMLQQEATVVLSHLLWDWREHGEEAVRRVRARHALAGSWR